MSVRPGTRLDGRYRLAERLAYGGMGEVWRAMDEVLSREVAVKILRPELAEDEAFVRRFRAEARTTSGLPHNGIAAVYDYGETRVGGDGQSPAPYDDGEADPVAYLVMELVPGEALSSMLSRDGALSPDLTLDLVAQAARALHAAHQRGVIHRDIKPANLMVTPDGRVKVTDFGIARPLDHEPLTATGQVMGTAHYLAPELAKGHDASALSDVYALGVVAYECLAGHRPFEGDNQVAVALAHLNEMPPPLPVSIPEPVRAVVAAAMEKDPQRRMPSAEAFAAALETLRYQQSGEEHLTPGTGVLPGSAAEAGLLSAGLLAPGNHGWTPGMPGGRDGGLGTAVVPAPVPQAPPPSGTHLLGPAVGPRTGTMTGGMPGHGGPGGGSLLPGAPDGRGGPGVPAPGGYDAGGYDAGGYGAPGYGAGGYGPGDPFRTPTAPGGISITPTSRPRGRSGSSGGQVLLFAGMAVVVVLVLFVMWMSGFFDSTGSTNVPSDPGSSPAQTTGGPSAVVPGESATTSSSTSTRAHRTSTSTTTRSPSPSASVTTAPTKSPTGPTAAPPPVTTSTTDNNNNEPPTTSDHEEPSSTRPSNPTTQPGTTPPTQPNQPSTPATTQGNTSGGGAGGAAGAAGAGGGGAAAVSVTP